MHDATALPLLPSGVSIAIAGSGGAGVMTAGTLLLAAAAKAGAYGLMVRTSGPQIRGGEAAALVRLAAHPVDSLDDALDLLLALDWQNVQRFADEIPLGADSLVIGDVAEGEAPAVFLATGARPAALPLKAIAKGIPKSWTNMVLLPWTDGSVPTWIAAPLERISGARFMRAASITVPRAMSDISPMLLRSTASAWSSRIRACICRIDWVAIASWEATMPWPPLSACSRAISTANRALPNGFRRSWVTSPVKASRSRLLRASASSASLVFCSCSSRQTFARRRPGNSSA